MVDDLSNIRRLTAHGQAFLTFVYGVFRRRLFVVPPGASVDGLAATFERPAFLAELSEVLSTFALERLVDNARSVVPPEIVLLDGRITRAWLWDERLADLLNIDIHQRIIGILAQMFLVASAVSQNLIIDDRETEGRELLQLSRWLEGETTKFARVGRRSPFAWAAVLARNDDSAAILASVDLHRMASVDDPVGVFDLVLMDSLIRATRQISSQLGGDIPGLPEHWRGIVDQAVLHSPLTSLMAEDIGETTEGQRGLDNTAAIMEPLFVDGNYLLIPFMGSAIIDAWINAEKKRIRMDDAEWGAFVLHFTDILNAFMELAQESGRYSVLTLVPRFYEQYFHVFREELWVARVRRAMHQRPRFDERQRFVDEELAIFNPLVTYFEIIDEIRQRNFAERSAEEEFLASRLVEQTTRLMRVVRLYREMLALPFYTE